MREHPWLIVAVVVVVFLAAVSMHAERAVGWRFLILCFVLSSLCGLGVVWILEQAVLRWSRLSKPKRRICVATGVFLVLVGTFAANRHKPDEFADDAVMCFALVFALLFWGLYRMFRFLDVLVARLFRR
jgi:hypothetical protein